MGCFVGDGVVGLGTYVVGGHCFGCCEGDGGVLGWGVHFGGDFGGEGFFDPGIGSVCCCESEKVCWCRCRCHDVACSDIKVTCMRRNDVSRVVNVLVEICFPTCSLNAGFLFLCQCGNVAIHGVLSTAPSQLSLEVWSQYY